MCERRSGGTRRNGAEHDPEKWKPVFPRDKREALARRSCSNKEKRCDHDAIPTNRIMITSSIPRLRLRVSPRNLPKCERGKATRSSDRSGHLSENALQPAQVIRYIAEFLQHLGVAEFTDHGIAGAAESDCADAAGSS